MKGLKVTLVVSLAAVVLCGLSGMAFAHTANCQSCHTMHNSKQGVAVRPAPTGGIVPSFLLVGNTPTDACLVCHAAYGQYANGDGYGSGGDFYWVTKTYTWGTTGSSSPGDRHGHNVISSLYGIYTDTTLAAAPGGTYNSQNLGCSSCHDPHAFVQNTALILRGPTKSPRGYAFTKAAPILKSPGRRTNNASTATNKTPVNNTRHTAFGSGMSDWCGNCHAAMLGGSGTHVHKVGPAGTFGSDMVTAYGQYVSTGAMTGSLANSYWEKVPFETGGTDCAALVTTSTAGPDTNSNVMCLSCHRAHASAYQYAGRWDFGSSNLASTHPLATDGGIGVNDVANKDYGYGGPAGTPYITNQRSLCNKCHAMDQ